VTTVRLQSTRKEAADGIDISSALQRLGCRIPVAAHFNDHLVGKRRELVIQARPDPNQNLRAQDVEKPLKQIESDRQRRKRDERRNVPARQGAVVDLQHVEGAGKRQNVDDTRKEKEKEPDAPIAADPIQRIRNCFLTLALGAH
jgi:hypothetical protein